MTFLCLIAALAVGYFFPLKQTPPVATLAESFVHWVEHHTNAGERRFGTVAWLLMAFIVVVPSILVYALAMRVHPVFGWLLNVGVLYLSIGFFEDVTRLERVRQQLRHGDRAAARGELQSEELAEVADDNALARAIIERGLLDAHRQTFALIFWFAVMPGFSGVLLYICAHAAARLWPARGATFAEFASQAFMVLDWIPQRLTAFAFAIVGDFEDALYCWRTQAAAWFDVNAGVVLASGAGAMGVRLGEPMPSMRGVDYRPELGLGERADADHIEAAATLLWRALALVMGLVLLFSLGAWVGD